MSSDERKPASTPPEHTRDASRWNRRLQELLSLSALILAAGIWLTSGGLFDIHLSGAAQQVANIALYVGLILILVAGFVLIIRTMRENPAHGWPQAWSSRLLVAAAVLSALAGLAIFADSLGIFPGWHLNNTENLVVAAVMGVALILLLIGAFLLIVAFIADIRQLVRSRRKPPSLPPTT